MKRLALIPVLPLFALLAACPGADKAPPPPVTKVDTTPARLDSLVAAIPPALPDTFKPEPRQPVRAPTIPPAPPALMEAVNRETAFTRFCFQEFGQKNDPGLRGRVDFVITVDGGGISNVGTGNAQWSSKAGDGVTQCLEQKAKHAWKLAGGVVKPGRYAVPINFIPT